MKTISFVAACSGSGKTTLIEKVVRILKSRGVRVAVIKHASKGFDLDRPGKDSRRFEQAGAETVVLVGPGKMAIMQTIDHEPTAEELEQRLDADLVIVEGFRKTARCKIEVFRRQASGERPLCTSDPSFLALVSDQRFDVPIPVFDLDDAEGVTAFLMKNFCVKPRCNL